MCNYTTSGTIVRIIKWSTSTYFNGVILTTLGDTVVVGILLHLAQVHLFWENTSSQTTVLYGNVAHFWCWICDPWWNGEKYIWSQGYHLLHCIHIWIVIWVMNQYLVISNTVSISKCKILVFANTGTESGYKS